MRPGLVPGQSGNVDALDIEAGLREAALIGYGDAKAQMVTQYALQRWQRGEETGAERTWLTEYPYNSFTAWRRILAAAIAAAETEN
jgi:hypothetical protein